ncbi:MAG: PQQ-like beta-propeller repeat protein, partial [Chlamydiae bacterium]|nr:PQQ-like beta-propeller repeat protein [Chlamydiota bacterium]
MRRVLFIAIAASWALGTAHGQLADTPWPMFMGNVRHTGQSGYAGPQSCVLLWSYKIGESTWSSPAVGTDETIYIGSDNNYLYCLNSDGTRRWRRWTGGNVRTSPALGSNGAVYFGSIDNYLYCLNPDGTLKWRLGTGEDVRSSPALESDGA